MRGGRTTAVPVLIVTGVLLLAGMLELASVIFEVSTGGADAVARLGGPAMALPFTAAALLAVVGGRGTRIAACFGATIAFVLRLVLVALLLVPGWRFTLPDVLNVAAGAVTGLGLLGFTLYLVLRHQDLSTEPDESRSQPVQPVQSVPPAQARAAFVPSQGAPWATASTPWPRANEADPNGTLIRPPRR